MRRRQIHMRCGMLQHGPVFLERTRAKQVHARPEALINAQNIYRAAHGLAGLGAFGWRI